VTEQKVTAEQIEDFSARAFRAVDMPPDDAQIVAAHMAQADLIGSDSHGIFRLPHYIARIRGGAINLRPNIHIDRQTAATAVVDGDNAMGHLVMTFAADVAVEKAAAAGIAWVGTFNSNHAGPAGLYTRMAVAHNMVGLYGAVASGNPSPGWGGTELLLGTNPVSIAVPSATGSPIVLDMATTVAANGKIKLAAQKGESIPEGWVIGWDGKPITDPRRANEGFLAPVGGAKGYGLAVMLGLLAGSLNGAAMGRDVVNFNTDHHSPTNTGQFLCMISLAAFGEVAAIESRFDRVANDLRASKTMPGFDRVRLPGDESFRKEQENAAEGITLSEGLIEALNTLATELEIAPLGV